jgi:hypothetical protein
VEVAIKDIRDLTVEQLQKYAHELIPNDRMPSSAFMETLSASEAVDTGLDLSHGAEVPREFQITSGLAVSGRDTILMAGTWCGTTLAIAILVSPLKHLQSSQVVRSVRSNA